MTQDIDHILNHISLKKSRRFWRWVAIAAIAALLIGIFASGNFRNAGFARRYIHRYITHLPLVTAL